jgi:hypothetical protein
MISVGRLKPVPVPVPSTTGGTNVAVTVITPVPVLVGKTEPMLGGPAVRTPVTKLGVNVGREVTGAEPAVRIPVTKLGINVGRRVTVPVTVQMAVGIHFSGGDFMPVAVPVPGENAVGRIPVGNTVLVPNVRAAVPVPVDVRSPVRVRVAIYVPVALVPV